MASAEFGDPIGIDAIIVEQMSAARAGSAADRDAGGGRSG
jgi:hypothetical protein